MSVYDWLIEQDRRLGEHGVPPLTPWWLAQLSTFYGDEKRRFVGRVGRGGVKSHTAVKIALAETLGREWPVPPGERHYFAFVSQNKNEATQRLVQLQTWLGILGIEHTRRGDAIDLGGLPLGFRVFACQIGAVSGFRCIGFVCDELAKWSNADGANPAPEVVASARAMSVTHRGEALEWCISSAFSTADYHCELVEAGEDERTQVAIATTWEANPTISEEDTRILEPDLSRWSREYASIPMDGAGEVFFSPPMIDACANPDMPAILKPRGGCWVSGAVDLAFRRDSSAIAIVRQEGGKLRVCETLELRPHAGAPLVPSEVARHFAEVARRHQVKRLITDLHAYEPMREHFSAYGIQLVACKSGLKPKVERHERVRTLVHAGEVEWSAAETDLARQLKALVQKPTAAGSLTITSQRSERGHADLAAAFILAASHVGDTAARLGTPDQWSRRVNHRLDSAERVLFPHAVGHKEVAEARMERETEAFLRRVRTPGTTPLPFPRRDD